MGRSSSVISLAAFLVLAKELLDSQLTILPCPGRNMALADYFSGPPTPAGFDRIYLGMDRLHR
jgi:hypothetical protein